MVGTRRKNTTPTKTTTGVKRKGPGRPRKTDSSPRKRTRTATTKSVVDEEKEYEVESILSAEFLVKWKGFPKSQATLEPLENLEGCHDLIYAFLKDYEAKHPSEKKANGAEEESEGEKEAEE